MSARRTKASMNVPSALYSNQIFLPIHLWRPFLWKYASGSDVLQFSIHSSQRLCGLKSHSIAFSPRPWTRMDHRDSHVCACLLLMRFVTSYCKLAVSEEFWSGKVWCQCWSRRFLPVQTEGLHCLTLPWRTTQPLVLAPSVQLLGIQN